MASITRLLLKRAINLLTRYAKLYSDCRCVDKIEQVKLNSDALSYAEDVEREMRV
jgi:hypothetical protein